MKHLCQDLEGVFTKKWSSFGPPFPIPIEPGDFLSPIKFFPNFLNVGIKVGGASKMSCAWK